MASTVKEWHRPFTKGKSAPAVNGSYVNTDRTLLLVLSLWLVGVDVRSVERAFETFLRSLLTSLSG